MESESIDAYEKLLELGKEGDFALYEDEGHSFLKIENLIKAGTRRVSFLTQTLEDSKEVDL